MAATRRRVQFLQKVLEYPKWGVHAQSQAVFRNFAQDTTSTTVSIGDVTKTVQRAKHPQLVPKRYLPLDQQVPPETRKHLRWMMQKDLLGQDIFLIGRPSPLRRSMAMQYLELTGREAEFVALSRDTTESDLKQRREIVQGTAHYIDQSAVRAAKEGRILILEGIEKAERNVLPVLNNLLENREMHLEDGRLLIPAQRYDKLRQEHSQEEMDRWKLVRVDENFRVIALGLPVPKYVGNPLDPPLRSRFQARDIRHLPFKEQMNLLQSMAPNLPSDAVSQVVSFAHTMVTDESANLGLPDFPVENLPPLIALLNQVPSLSLFDGIQRLYPYKNFLPPEGVQSVVDTLKTFQLLPEVSSAQILRLESVHSDSANPGKRDLEVSVHGQVSRLTVPSGPHPESETPNYHPTAYQEMFLTELLTSHAVKDFCIIGPKGCGKTVILERMADLLGYEMEPIMLYQDMTARDLLQQRTTLDNGDTVWRYSPLVLAAIEGKLAVLDGIHRIHRGTLSVLHRLVHDRELQLYDGTRLLRSDRYDAIKEDEGLTDQDMEDQQLLRIHDNFRIAALAEPPVIGGNNKEQWLTPEVLSMFLFHVMRPLSHQEELSVLQVASGKPSETMGSILKLTHRLRKSEDASLKSIANSLSTRQLLRISKRLKRFPDESVYHAVQKACLTRFLPTLPREALDKIMSDLGIQRPVKEIDESGKTAVCKVENGCLTLGNTTTEIYEPDTKTKIPETLFYDTVQNIAVMEAMLQDFLLGEHLLLVGNQGVGKNKVVDRLLHLLNRPREYIQLHRDTTVQSLTLQPTVKEGVIIYEDSPLVKAVKTGNILVVDEADKAPTHVTCILKTLVETGEMILSDGRRIVPQSQMSRHASTQDKLIPMHPDFRMFVLANRPGFPFLGNDFFGSLGDLFSCHAIDNPSMDSEISMLRQYGPNVPEETLRRLVRTFSELRNLADEGSIQYPYSTREVVNIVKHLERFPNEGLGNVVRNVFDFDSYDKETRESLQEVLHKHGIPLGTSARNISLAREFELPAREMIGEWQIQRGGGKRVRFMALPITSKSVDISDPENVSVQNSPLDRVEARGVGFSELHSSWMLPFHEYASVGDVVVKRDQHRRPLFDQIFVATSNPIWLFGMTPLGHHVQKLPLNHFFETRRFQNTIPKIKMATLGGNFEGALAVHDEVTHGLVLVDPKSASVLRVNTSTFFDSVKEVTRKITQRSGKSNSNFVRMLTNLSQDNILVFYNPFGNSVEMLDLNSNPLVSHKVDLPVPIKSLHILNKDQFLVVADLESGRMAEPSDDSPPQPEGERLYLLKREDPEAEMPNILNPISQTTDITSISKLGEHGLTDLGLKMVLGEAMQAPNTLFNSDYAYATLVLGFPELEFSANEVHSWPKSAKAMNAAQHSKNTGNNLQSNTSRRLIDQGRNVVLLRESCQLVKPVSPQSIPEEFSRHNYGLSSPGNVSAYLEVVDLMGNKLRYVPIPEASHSSSYSSWYKQTYPDQVMAMAEMSNEGLVTVDNAGSVRLWETGVANLERSLSEWRQMLGTLSEDQLTIQRGQVGDLDSPKHGKTDPNNDPHVGGNTWAGGTGGRDTAGLGGIGGPYRLDAGHNVHQVSDEAKNQVPEHIQKAAREMNRKAFEERLREIRMSQYDADLYEKYAVSVRKQVQALRTIINGLQAKAKDRQWLKNQTSGELDDTKLIEGIAGERSIYKKRGEQEPEPGAPQEKPKRLRLLVDVSGSMYRFNGHDQRLERMMESALMVMEALEGFTDKFKYDIIGHSGEERAIPLVKSSNLPKNEKDRLEVMRTMLAHSQFCMSGDHTLAATVTAINELGKQVEDHDETFVIVLSDANFDRYGISPKSFSQILNRNEQVNTFAIFIGSLGDQAERLAKNLPSGKAFVCLDTKKIPEILKTIFTSTLLK